MSKKLTTILLASASIAAISAIGFITYKKIAKKNNYAIIERKSPVYDPSKDPTIKAIENAVNDNSDIDE